MRIRCDKDVVRTEDQTIDDLLQNNFEVEHTLLKRQDKLFSHDHLQARFLNRPLLQCAHFPTHRFDGISSWHDGHFAPQEGQ